MSDQPTEIEQKMIEFATKTAQTIQNQPLPDPGAPPKNPRKMAWARRRRTFTRNWSIFCIAS